MIPIVLDTAALVQEFSLTKSQSDKLVEYTVEAVAAQFARNWDMQARNNLNSTRQMYRRSLVVGKINSKTAYVSLVGKFPNMLEKGASAWDMKSNFARSNKIKYTKKGGWYLTVPFRWATPGALGESSIFSNKMPTAVYRAVRKTVDSSRSAFGGKRSSGGGLKIGDIPSQYRTPKSRLAFSDIATKTTFKEYQHKTSMYAGIIHSTKMYENAAQGSYTSFRRVSSNSDPMSWIHRGFAARNFAQRALQMTNIPKIAENAVDDFLASIGF